MIRNRRAPACATIALASLLAAGVPRLCATESTPAPTVEAKVTYVSGATVYIDAGTEHGLAVGARVEILRAGEVVARLRVTYVTATRASVAAEDDAPLAGVEAGDVARFTPAVAEAPAPAAASTTTSTSYAATHGAGIRGRVGLRWLSVDDKTGFGQDFSQPALDLRLVGLDVGGSAVDFDVDCRPRRTYRTKSDGTSDDDASNRIYSLMAAYRPGPFRIAVGRQRNPPAGSLVLLDGITAEYRTPRFATGLIAGSEPDPEDFGFDSDTKDFGAFVEGGSAPGAVARWSVGGGALTSKTLGEINRDWLYVTGRLNYRGFFGLLLQELDVNRGWRKELEASTLTRSGSFLSLRQAFAHGVSGNAGWDSRRNVRVYRDRVTPATEFDDAYREGLWAGVDWRAAHWLAGAEARRSSGGSAGTAEAYTLNLGTTGWTAALLEGRLRATHYTTPRIDGDLVSGSVAVEAWAGRLRFDVHGGVRNDQDTTLFADSVRVSWMGSELSLLAAPHLLLTLAYDRTTGGDEDNDQTYFSCSYRF